MITPISLPIPKLLENYSAYRGKRVQLTGQIVEKNISGNYGGFNAWNFFLGSGGKRIRCFEKNYDLRPNHTADSLVVLALVDQQRGKKAEVTVIGDVEKEGLELYSIEYMHTTIRTDFFDESEDLLFQIEKLNVPQKE